MQVALWIGFFPMVLLAVGTSLLGMLLLQVQGESMRRQLSLALSRGERAGPAVVQGGMGWIGALLLILPGFLTDVLGLACLVPGVRRRLGRYFLRQSGAGGGSRPSSRGSRVIEGDFTREMDEGS